MRTLTSVRAVVFDLDGTLVDSLPDIAGHLNAALAEVGLPTYSPAEVRRWVGSGAAQLVRRAVEEARVEQVLERFRAHYRAAPYDRTAVFPGIGDVLDSLATRHALAILSNKPHDLVVAIADGLLARYPFRAILGEQPGTPRKPDPTALLGIARSLGAEDCVLVGDSEIDIATARAARMTSVAVTWGLCDRDALVGADYLVDTPAELAALFSASL